MMAKIIKLPLSVQIKLGLENDIDNQYVSLRDYNLDVNFLKKERDDLANKEQELIATQEEIRRLKEALKPFAEFAKITAAKSDITEYLSCNYLFEDGGDRFYQITGSDFKKAFEALND